jgi:hypothetical protein
MRSWKPHDRSLVRLMICAAVALVAVPMLAGLLAPHLRNAGIEVERRALADFAEFTVDPGGMVTGATINGSTASVPPGDRIVMEFYLVGGGADQRWSLWYQDRWSRHSWIEGYAPAGTFGGWDGPVGLFLSNTYPVARRSAGRRSRCSTGL